MRYRLRTLLIAIAVGPVILAACWYHVQELLATDLGKSVFGLELMMFSLLATVVFLWIAAAGNDAPRANP